MRWWTKMTNGIKKGLREWLQITPGGYALSITQDMDFEIYAIRNRIWYRGDGYELEQFYRSVNNRTDRTKFWASQCSPGMDIRKLHVGLPALIVRELVNIVLGDMGEFELENQDQKEMWQQIAKENKVSKLLNRALAETLVVGDGAFKIAIDPAVSDYPIIQWYPGDRIELIYAHGRLKEIIFKSPYKSKTEQYVLHEHYGYGYVESHLYRGDTEVPLSKLEETKNLSPRTDFKGSTAMLAVPLMVYENARYEGRGGSIFDGKLDSFDALDEAWSQWMDALRSGRSRTYIPSNLIPRDTRSGELLKPNPFDNRFIATEADMGEGKQNKISTEQPSIPHEGYLASYITALDLCLQGVISPSTLGIDVKKLDNAEAQREKEKTTLYTRGNIISALQDSLSELVAACLNAWNILHAKAIEDIKVNIEWGEYANPSFEAQITAIAQARQGGIMSIEKAVDELYGKSLDAGCKAQEVARLKAEQGVAEMEEPELNLEGVDVVGG